MPASPSNALQLLKRIEVYINQAKKNSNFRANIQVNIISHTIQSKNLPVHKLKATQLEKNKNTVYFIQSIKIQNREYILHK